MRSAKVRPATFQRTAPLPSRASLVWPSGEAQGVGPDPGAGEEVALGVSGEVLGVDFLDLALVDVAMGDHPLLDEKPEGRRFLAVRLVVPRTRRPHAFTH